MNNRNSPRRNGTNLKEWVKKIPGFRSDRLWKKIIASFVYLFLIVIVIPALLSSGIGNFISLIVTLIFFISIAALIRGKLPLLRLPNRKAAGILMVVSFFLIILLSNISNRDVENSATKSSEPAAVSQSLKDSEENEEQASAQKAEEERKAQEATEIAEAEKLAAVQKAEEERKAQEAAEIAKAEKLAAAQKAEEERKAQEAAEIVEAEKLAAAQKAEEERKAQEAAEIANAEQDAAARKAEQEAIAAAEEKENQESAQIASAGYDTSGGDKNCGDFPTQAAAQAFMEASGPSDPHRLDGNDDDDIACESLP